VRAKHGSAHQQVSSRLRDGLEAVTMPKLIRFDVLVWR
jgi:hypothetical protein